MNIKWTFNHQVISLASIYILGHSSSFVSLHWINYLLLVGNYLLWMMMNLFYVLIFLPFFSHLILADHIIITDIEFYHANVLLKSLIQFSQSKWNILISGCDLSSFLCLKSCYLFFLIYFFSVYLAFTFFLY